MRLPQIWLLNAVATVLLFNALLSCTVEPTLAPTANLAPFATIQAPVDREVFTDLDTVDFVFTLADGNGLNDIQHWMLTSSIDGLLAEGDQVPSDGVERASVLLSPGTHAVSLRVQDADGAEGTDAITLEVEEAPVKPSAEIVQPTEREAFEPGERVQLLGSVSDPNQDAASLTVIWTVLDAPSDQELYSIVAPATEAGATNTGVDRAVPGDPRRDRRRQTGPERSAGRGIERPR